MAWLMRLVDILAADLAETGASGGLLRSIVASGATAARAGNGKLHSLRFRCLQSGQAYGLARTFQGSSERRKSGGVTSLGKHAEDADLRGFTQPGAFRR
jgi:hypothetical protein